MQLTLDSIRLENFMLHASTYVEFDESSSFIEGHNHDTGMDSNAAGKTQLGDGVCWVLFDETTRPGKKDDIIGSAEKWVMGEVVLTDESGDKYLFRRSREHPKHGTGIQFSKNGNEDGLTLRTPTMTQQRIEEFLGMGYHVFKNSVFSIQHDLNRFLDMDPEDRKKFVIEALGLEVLNTSADLIRKDLRELKKELSDAEMSLNTSNTRAESSQEHLDRAEGDLAVAERSAEEEAEKLKEQIADLEVKCDRADDEADKKAKPIVDEVQRIEKDLEGLSDRSEELERTETTARTLAGSLGGILRANKIAQADIEKHEREIQNLKKLEGGKCPTCFQVVGAEGVDECVAGWQKKIDKLKVQVTKEKKKGAQAKKEEGELQEKIAQIKKENQRRSELQRTHDRKNREAEQVFEQSDTQIKVWENEIKNLRGKLESLGDRKKELSKCVEMEKQNLRHWLGNQEKDQAEVDKLLAEIQPREWWLERFSTDLQIRVLQSVCSTMESLANEYLDTLRCGLHFVFDIRESRGKQKFFLDTVDALGKKLPPSARSGGERARLRIAQDLATKRLTDASFNLSWIDEALDGMDGAGVTTALNLFKDLSDSGRQLIGISHNPKAKTFFNRVITVERRDNVSGVVQ